MLFISSYVPLYILLIIKNVLERCTNSGCFDISWTKIKNAHYFDEVNDYAILILVALSLVSMFYLMKITQKRGGEHFYKIIEVEDQTGNVYFNYISIYLLSCLGLTLNSIVDVFVLFFVMILVGYIYVSNHMTYMNPTLQFLGYKVYEGKVNVLSTNENFQTVIISDKKLLISIDSSYVGSGKEDFICLFNRGEEKGESVKKTL